MTRKKTKTWEQQQVDNLKQDLETLNIAIEKGRKRRYTTDKKVEVDFFVLVAVVGFCESAMREFEYMAKIRDLINEMI